MTRVTRSLFISRCFIGIAVALFATNSLAQTPPFVPEAGTGKQILDTATEPVSIFVQANAVDVKIEALTDFHPNLNAFSVNAVLAPSSVLGPMAPAGTIPAGQIFRGTFPVDVSSVGTIDFLATAAYNGDPRRARGMVSVDVVPEPIGPCLPPDCIIVIPSDPISGSVQVLVDYWDDVTANEADAAAAGVSASTSVGLTLIEFSNSGNFYVYELDVDPAVDPVGAEQSLDDVIDAFVAQVDVVEFAIRNSVLGDE